MATVSRLGGAIFVRTEGRYFLVGDLKEPLAFDKFGFVKPADRDVREIPFVELAVSGVELVEPKAVFSVEKEGEALVKKLAASFIITRNGSVSERLWTLALDSSPTPKSLTMLKDLNWLAVMPDDIWDIVRDTVLRC